MKVLVAQSHPTLCNTMDGNTEAATPGSYVLGDSPGKKSVEWVAIPFSKGSSQPRDWTWVSWIAGRFFTIWATREALKDKFLSQLTWWRNGNKEWKKEALIHHLLCTWPSGCETSCGPPRPVLLGYQQHHPVEARCQESWEVCPFPWPGDWAQVSWIAGRFFTNWDTREAHWFLSGTPANLSSVTSFPV